MAIWFRKSINVSANYLKAKTGLWGLLNQRHLSPCFHSNFSSPTSLNGKNYRNPPSFLGNSTTLFGSRRFESVKAGRQEELRYDNGGHQDQVLWFPILFFFIEGCPGQLTTRTH